MGGGDKPYLHTLKRRTCTHAHTHTATGRYLLQCCRGCLRVTRDTPVCGTAEQALPGMWDPRRLLLLVCRLHYWRARAVCCRQTGGGDLPVILSLAHGHTHIQPGTGRGDWECQPATARSRKGEEAGGVLPPSAVAAAARTVWCRYPRVLYCCVGCCCVGAWVPSAIPTRYATLTTIINNPRQREFLATANAVVISGAMPHGDGDRCRVE